nr:hypothetical protein HmN_000931000 [Hymenolepis microstoma]
MQSPVMRVSISIQPGEQDSISHYSDQRSSSARHEVRRSRSRRLKGEKRVLKIQPKECEPPARQFFPIYQSTPSSVDRKFGRTRSKCIYSSQAHSPSNSRKLRKEEERILYPSRSLKNINVEVACSRSISSSSTSSVASNFDVSGFRIVKGENCNALFQQPIENGRVIRARPMVPRVVVELKHPQRGRRRRHRSQPKPKVAEKKYHKSKLQSSSRPRLERKQTSSSSSEDKFFRVDNEICESPDFRNMKKRVFKRPVVRNMKDVLQPWDFSNQQFY